MSYKNNQPLQVLNKYDETTGEMVTDPTNPISDKYGDRREVREGRSLYFNETLTYLYYGAVDITSWTEFEFFVRFKMDVTFTNTSFRIVSIQHSGGDDIRLASISDLGVLSFTMDDGTAFGAQLQQDYTDGNWHYAFCSWSETTKLLRVITDLETRELNYPSNSFDFSTATGATVIANRAGGLSVDLSYKGDVESFALKNTLFTEAERTALIEGCFNNISIEIYSTLEEEVGTIVFDLTKNHNATLINASSNSYNTVNLFCSRANDYGYTLSDGSTYYYDQALTQLIPANVIIPRDESNTTKCCAYITGGVQADLQYKGENPYPAKVVQSGCFAGTGSNLIDIGLITDLFVDDFMFKFRFELKNLNDIVLQRIFRTGSYGESNGFVLRTLDSVGFQMTIGKGQVNLADPISKWKIGVQYCVEITKIGTAFNYTRKDQHGNVLYTEDKILNSASMDYLPTTSTIIYGESESILLCDFQWIELDGAGDVVETRGNWPLTNLESDGTTYYDVSGNGNHGTLINGSSANYGLQDEFHYLQDKGFNIGEQRFWYSTDFSIGVWAARFLTKTTGQPDVDGGNLAVLITNTAAADCELRQTTTVENFNVLSTVSIVVKAGTSPYVYLRGFANNYTVIFNVTDETYSITSGTVQLASIVDIGDGWKLCKVVANGIGGVNGQLYSFGVTDNMTQINSTTIGNSIYLYKPHFYETSIAPNVVPVETEGVGTEVYNRKIPAKEDKSTDVFANTIFIPQNGYRFLDSGSKLRHPKAPALIQADENNILFDISGEPIDQEFDDFTTNNLSNNQHFNDVSNTNYIEQMRYHKPDNLASQQQINTEKKLTNN